MATCNISRNARVWQACNAGGVTILTRYKHHTRQNREHRKTPPSPHRCRCHWQQNDLVSPLPMGCQAARRQRSQTSCEASSRQLSARFTRKRQLAGCSPETFWAPLVRIMGHLRLVACVWLPRGVCVLYQPITMQCCYECPYRLLGPRTAVSMGDMAACCLAAAVWQAIRAAIPRAHGCYTVIRLCIAHAEARAFRLHSSPVMGAGVCGSAGTVWKP